VALDELLDRMRRENGHETTALLAEARTAAERSVEEAQVAIAWERAKRLTNREDQLRAEAERTIEEVRRKARQEILITRREVADRVVARTIALAPELSRHPAYVAAVQSALDEALQILGARKGKLVISRELLHGVDGRVPSGMEVIEDDRETGFRLQASDGRLEIRQTIQEQLRRMAPTLRIAAARALEPEA
jgi:vacuolar-type H+-ATPase subunit E/Vma4